MLLLLLLLEPHLLHSQPSVRCSRGTQLSSGSIQCSCCAGDACLRLLKGGPDSRITPCHG